MNYVRPYKENYKNKVICDWSAGHPVAHEKEALLLSKREIMDRSILDRAEHEEDTGIALLISSNQPEETELRVIYGWYANDPQSANMVTFM